MIINMPADKLLHFIACETITMVIAIVGLFAGLGNWAYPIAFVISMAVGIGKELKDRKATGFDRWDLVFDFIDSIVGMTLIYLGGVPV